MNTRIFQSFDLYLAAVKRAYVAEAPRTPLRSSIARDGIIQHGFERADSPHVAAIAVLMAEGFDATSL